MRSLYATLSFRYLRRRRGRVILIVLSIAAGVSMLVATRALNQAMARAAVAAANPLAGVADLVVGNGEAPVAKSLARELQQKVPGVRAARPRVFEGVKLPDLGGRPALMVGIDLLAEEKDRTSERWQVEYDPGVKARMVRIALGFGTPALVGKGLDAELTSDKVRVQARGRKQPFTLRRAGAIDAGGPAAALGGSLLLLDPDGAGT